MSALHPGRCVALVAEWARLNDRCNVPGEMTDDEVDAAVARQCEIENELDDTAAETMADILAKARILALFEVKGVGSFDPEKHNPTIGASLLVDLERLAGGVS